MAFVVRRRRKRRGEELITRGRRSDRQTLRGEGPFYFDAPFIHKRYGYPIFMISNNSQVQVKHRMKRKGGQKMGRKPVWHPVCKALSPIKASFSNSSVLLPKKFSLRISMCVHFLNFRAQFVIDWVKKKPF